MLIRIKQVRKLANGKPGTDIQLGKGKNAVILQFRPSNPALPEEDHVCDVSNPDHVAQLLSIREGFEVHESALGSADAKAAVARAASAGSAARAGTVVANPASLSDAELEAELERRRAAREQKAGAQTSEPQQSSDAGDRPASGERELSKAELIEAVTKKTGKKPHPSTSVQKLQEMLAK